MITGNYNTGCGSPRDILIIPYQVITGNYNLTNADYESCLIIPYQVIMRKIRKVYWNYGKIVINLYTTTKNRKPCKSKFPVSQQKSARRDSNPRPRPWQGRAPPTEPLAHIWNCIVAFKERETGLEPAAPTLARSCSTNWATRAYVNCFVSVCQTHSISYYGKQDLSTNFLK